MQTDKTSDKQKKTYSQLRSRKTVKLEYPWTDGKQNLFPSLNEIIKIAKNWRVWSNTKKTCGDFLFWKTREQTKERFDVPVEIEYHAYMCRMRDWDNHGASFKFVGDALQKAQVIQDDNVKWVPRFTPFQHKVAHLTDQRVEIIIYEYLQ